MLPDEGVVKTRSPSIRKIYFVLGIFTLLSICCLYFVTELASKIMSPFYFGRDNPICCTPHHWCLELSPLILVIPALATPAASIEIPCSICIIFSKNILVTLNLLMGGNSKTITWVWEYSLCFLHIVCMYWYDIVHASYGIHWYDVINVYRSS